MDVQNRKLLHSWEVGYAEATGLRSNTTYLGHVRAMCEWDTEYGPWSDLSALPTGVYVVAIHTPAGIATKRLIVGSEK